MIDLKVYILTDEQASSLQGKEVEPGWLFTPVNYEGLWMLTQDQVEFSSFPENDWVKDLDYGFMEGTDWINLAPGVWDSSAIHIFLPQDPYI